ncbi:mechanosensitive ion channel family protein [Flavobacterium sp. AG291]|uniref:mechanosensitive ion channel family protein n=1 Tax=Flavobacterium sp. AG291 TaxID=2184000 RepID=UPI000E09EEEA|nr:mechanosensitive ion channel domain-containing protein [Flavobacterium sp. AG291]RDI15849.1 small conductance mechanosensitive channel [Flavobacterium sp. AG291]
MIPLFIDTDKAGYFIEWATTTVINFIPNLLRAVAFLVIGIMLIKIFRKIITRLMMSREMDPTFLKFVLDVCTWIFRVTLIISIIDQLGVQTTSLMALLGTIGIAVGLSLQGSLSNFAGGLLIVLFKPFRVGDYIEAQGQGGTVQSIQIFSTQLLTSNNQVVYLPNGTLSNNTIKNFSQEPLRRAEILLSVSYNSDLRIVKEAIQSVINSDNKILLTPKPGIEVNNLTENGIIMKVLLWSERSNHSSMVSDFYENIKTAFENSGIEMQLPHKEK